MPKGQHYCFFFSHTKLISEEHSSKAAYLIHIFLQLSMCKFLIALPSLWILNTEAGQFWIAGLHVQCYNSTTEELSYAQGTVSPVAGGLQIRVLSGQVSHQKG